MKRWFAVITTLCISSIAVANWPPPSPARPCYAPSTSCHYCCVNPCVKKVPVVSYYKTFIDPLSDFRIIPGLVRIEPAEYLDLH